MTDQQDVSNGHTSVSNAPEEPSEVAVPEGQEVVEEPSEGRGFEGAPAGTLQAMETVPGYEQRRAPLDQIWANPNIVMTAPDTSRLPNIAEASYGPLGVGMNPVDSVVEAPFAASSAAESVQEGTDDRIQITITADYPWRVHASLRITAADGNFYLGTGWFIGRNR
jgi:glutamyl endopeptidase